MGFSMEKNFEGENDQAIVFDDTSFLCYYFSLALAFFLLGTQATDGLILGPALTSVVGDFLLQ